MNPKCTGPLTIEWRITGRCNEGCYYCYGPEKEIHPSKEVANQIATVLLQTDAKVIRFSGGEPLIHASIVPVIKRLSHFGKQIVLSTNGLRFCALRPELEPFLA